MAVHASGHGDACVAVHASGDACAAAHVSGGACDACVWACVSVCECHGLAGLWGALGLIPYSIRLIAYSILECHARELLKQGGRSLEGGRSLAAF